MTLSGKPQGDTPVASAGGAPQTARMPAVPPSPDQPLRVGLDIAVGLDPIEGVVHVPDAGPRPFTGWLALMARIDEVREAGPRRPVSVQRR
jgi:hypothetical protein